MNDSHFDKTEEGFHRMLENSRYTLLLTCSATVEDGKVGRQALYMTDLLLVDWLQRDECKEV